MSKFADGYSSYLMNYFNYTSKSKTFRKYFKNSIVSITATNFTPKKLIDNIADFPKYPYFMNAFIKDDSINLINIHESSIDDSSVLVNFMVDLAELEKKRLYDKIPSSLDSFLTELNFQFSYISSPTDLYNRELVIKSFITENQYRNFFSDLYTPLFRFMNQNDGETAGLENSSFFYEYMLYSCLYNLISISHNIYPKLLAYLMHINISGQSSDRVDQQAMLDGFGEFVTRYSSNLSKDLTIIIGKSIYDFQNISEKMIQDLSEIILNKLNNNTNGLYKSFYNFSRVTKLLSPVDFLAGAVNQYLTAIIATDVVARIYNDDAIVDQNKMLIQSLEEDNKYFSYMEKITESELKNYLFLCFLYRFWPMKFLNVLQLSIKEFTENIIKNFNDNMMTSKDYNDLFDYFVNNNINYTNLSNFLRTYLTPPANIVPSAKFTFIPGVTEVICSNVDSYNSININDYIYADGDDRKFALRVISKNLPALKLITDDKYGGLILNTSVDVYRYNFNSPNYIHNISLNYEVAKFACINYYIYALEEYFKSASYDTFIKELSENIFIFLRNNGHVEYGFNWYEYHTIIDVYLKIYLRWKLLDPSKRCLLPNFNNAGYIFTKGSSIVYCEDLKARDMIANGNYIFAEYDTLDNAVQVISRGVTGSRYFLRLASPYSGQSTEAGTHTSALFFNSTDVTLFNNVTLNFVNKAYHKLLINEITDPTFGINIIIPSNTELKDYFTTISSPSQSSFAKSMHQFSENMVLSTLTREAIFSTLSNFV